MRRAIISVMALLFLFQSPFSLEVAQHMQDILPTRPGHFAELEELEAARKAATVSSYDLFIARHPNSRYAATAKVERSKLIKQ
jgi:hypothetical protein